MPLDFVFYYYIGYWIWLSTYGFADHDYTEFEDPLDQPKEPFDFVVALFYPVMLVFFIVLCPADIVSRFFQRFFHKNPAISHQ